MTNSQAMSIVARAILDRQFLDYICELPDWNLYSDHSFSQDEIPVEQIRLFTGLILRIKHGFLWESAPLTMAYLETKKVLFRVFSEYTAIITVSDILKLSIPERTEKFLSFLVKSEYLSPNLQFVKGVSGLAAHELRMWNISRRERLKFSTSVIAQFELMKLPHEHYTLKLRNSCTIAGYSDDPKQGLACQEVDLEIARVVILYGLGKSLLINSSLESVFLQMVKEEITLRSLVNLITVSIPEKQFIFEIAERYVRSGHIVVGRIY